MSIVTPLWYMSIVISVMKYMSIVTLLWYISIVIFVMIYEYCDTAMVYEHCDIRNDV